MVWMSIVYKEQFCVTFIGSLLSCSIPSF